MARQAIGVDSLIRTAPSRCPVHRAWEDDSAGRDPPWRAGCRRARERDTAWSEIGSLESLERAREEAAGSPASDEDAVPDHGIAAKQHGPNRSGHSHPLERGEVGGVVELRLADRPRRTRIEQDDVRVSADLDRPLRGHPEEP